MVKKSIDGVIKFYPKSHKYKDKKGKVYTSVTTIINELFPPFDSRKIAKGVAYNRSKTEGKKVSVAKVLKEWKVINQEAINQGSLVHSEIEMYLLDNSLYDIKDVLHPLSVIGIDYIKTIMSELTYVKSITPEVIVYDEESSIAGTIDLLVEMEDGSCYIIDWKTNKELKTSNKYSKGCHPLTKDMDDCNVNHYNLQLNLYRLLLKKPVYGMFLWHLTPEGVKEVEVVPNDNVQCLIDERTDKR